MATGTINLPIKYATKAVSVSLSSGSSYEPACNKTDLGIGASNKIIAIMMQGFSGLGSYEGISVALNGAGDTIYILHPEATYSNPLSTTIVAVYI